MHARGILSTFHNPIFYSLMGGAHILCVCVCGSYDVDMTVRRSISGLFLQKTPGYVDDSYMLHILIPLKDQHQWTELW